MSIAWHYYLRPITIILAWQLCFADVERKEHPMERLTRVRWPYSLVGDAKANE